MLRHPLIPGILLILAIAGITWAWMAQDRLDELWANYYEQQHTLLRVQQQRDQARREVRYLRQLQVLDSLQRSNTAAPDSLLREHSHLRRLLRNDGSELVGKE